jgi:hypothetical protein
VKQVNADDKNYRPPMALTGPDPSAKKSDEVFGLDLGSELDLRAALLPPDLPEGVSKGLANALVDVIAIPGGFTGGTDESEGNEMALLGEAMILVVRRNQMEEGRRIRVEKWKAYLLAKSRSGHATKASQCLTQKLRDKIINHHRGRNACKQWQTRTY